VLVPTIWVATNALSAETFVLVCPVPLAARAVPLAVVSEKLYQYGMMFSCGNAPRRS